MLAKVHMLLLFRDLYLISYLTSSIYTVGIFGVGLRARHLAGTARA